MSISFRAASSQASANSTALTVNKPTGTASGDLMLAHIFSNNTSLPTTVPNDWNLEDSFSDGGILQMIYSKTAGGSEGASYEWDWAVGTIHAGVMIALQSSISAAMSVHAIDKQANLSSTTTTFKAVTTTVANTFLVFMAQIGANASRAPDGGEDERYDTGLIVHQYGMTTPFVGPGATGTHTCTGASAATSKAYTIAVSEAVPPPTAPGDVTATAASATQIDLAWTDNATDETAYSVERSADGSTGWSEIATPAADAESYSDTGLASETQYFYRVRANNAGTYSSYSGTANATTDPATPDEAPSNLTATAITASRVDLSWDHDGVNTDGYSVEQSANGTTGWSEIDTTTEKSYSVTGLAQNTTFYWRVRAYNA